MEGGPASVPWPIGIGGYPHPENPLSGVSLVELASETGATVVQVAVRGRA
jgi:hypothetical protein